MSGTVPPPHHLPSRYAQGQLSLPFVNWIDSSLNMDRFLKILGVRMLLKDVFQEMEGETCHYSWPSDLIQGSYKCKNTKFEQFHELKNNNLREKYFKHSLLLLIIRAQIFCHFSPGKLNEYEQMK